MKHYDQVDYNNYVLNSENENYREFYKKQNHCCYCGHELDIKTVKRINSSKLTEIAHCPSCKQDIINQKHSLN